MNFLLALVLSPTWLWVCKFEITKIVGKFQLQTTLHNLTFWYARWIYIHFLNGDYKLYTHQLIDGYLLTKSTKHLWLKLLESNWELVFSQFIVSVEQFTGCLFIVSLISGFFSFVCLLYITENDTGKNRKSLKIWGMSWLSKTS